MNPYLKTFLCLLAMLGLAALMGYVSGYLIGAAHAAHSCAHVAATTTIIPRVML